MLAEAGVIAEYVYPHIYGVWKTAYKLGKSWIFGYFREFFVIDCEPASILIIVPTVVAENIVLLGPPERIRPMGAVSFEVDLRTFVGPSLQYCDYLLRYGRSDPGPSTAVSTIAIQTAGFHEVMDSEDMFRKWVCDLQDKRLLPPV